MEDDLSASDPLREYSVNPHLILTEWLLAVDTLSLYYQQLTSLLTKKTGQQAQQAHFPDTDRYIGQCPLIRLLSLQVAMQSELAGLLQEMDYLSQVKSAVPDTKYKRMVSHTAILHQLNQRAHTKLQLANLPF